MCLSVLNQVAYRLDECLEIVSRKDKAIPAVFHNLGEIPYIGNHGNDAAGHRFRQL